jgi:hypothetical protein
MSGPVGDKSGQRLFLDFQANSNLNDDQIKGLVIGNESAIIINSIFETLSE